MASLPAWVTLANISELIKLAALLIGGWWTWTLFVRQRTGVARANLSQTVKDWSLTATRRLVRVDVTIENKGTTPIRPRTAEIVLYQVRPATDPAVDALLAARLARGNADDTLEWPEIARRALALTHDDFFVEPGESEHLWIDFVIPAAVQAVDVWSRVDCGAKYDDLYWDITSLKQLT